MAETRYVTDWDSHAGRGDPEQRYRLYRLCLCAACQGARELDGERCPECRGEGRTRELVATVASPEALGLALVTLGREGEFEDPESGVCPVGILDTMGEVGQKWILRPWLPSPRNVSDAGRVLAHSKRKARPS